MPLGGPGPRDWSPPDPWGTPRAPNAGTRRTPPTIPAAPWPQRDRRQTRPWAWATLAVLLGAGSVVIGLTEPQHAGLQTGFLVSTIGITAIVIGVRTVKQNRSGSSVARAFGRGGALLGGVGTALMAYAVVASVATGTGVHLPALSLTAPGDASARSAAHGAPDAPVASVEAPTAATERAVDPIAAPDTVEAERASLAQAAGTLAYVMRQRFADGPYPEELVVDPLQGRVVLLDGTGLAPVAPDARLLYSVAQDRTSWSVTIVGARFGAVATFSSESGTVQAG